MKYVYILLYVLGNGEKDYAGDSEIVEVDY